MNSKDEAEKRRKANKSILERFMRGETLATVPPDATWYPPRPIIAKDKEAIKKIYGMDLKEKEKKVKLSIVSEEGV